MTIGGYGSAANASALPRPLTELLEAVALRSSVLALDYDGTLAPFRVERMEAVPSPEVVGLLQRLVCERATCLVIVSGRPVAEIASLLRISPLPEIWGAHGWEHRSLTGELSRYELPIAARAALDREGERLTAAGVALNVERKSASIAVHWRGVEDGAAAALRQLVEQPWAVLRVECGLEIRSFDGGMELRHPARNKGSVIEELLTRAPAGTPIAYAGDDDTDEDAFRAVAGHGLGIRVNSGKRPSAASVSIVEGLLPVMLAGWLDATRRVPPGIQGGGDQATKAGSRSASD